MRTSPLDVPSKVPCCPPASALVACLRELDEATVHLCGCLGTRDVSLLIADRLSSHLGANSTIYLLDARRKQLRPVSDASKPDHLARSCLERGLLQRDGSRTIMPLSRESSTFGVLEVVSNSELGPDVLDAITERVSTMMLNAMSFEHSRAHAFTDTLTELPNERAFYSLLERHTAVGEPFTLLTLDIAGFERINSDLGHAAGDRVLHAVAGDLASSIRQMDQLARSINDEFLLLLPGISCETALEPILKRLSAAVRASTAHGMYPSEVILNQGFASYPTDGTSVNVLLHKARMRRQVMKETDSGKVIIFPKR